jgi:hypothetical protein
MSENLFVQSGEYNIGSDVALTMTVAGDLVVTGAISGGATFQGLTDTPEIYEPGKFVRVNDLGTELEYSATSSLGGWDAGTTVESISILQLVDVFDDFALHNGDVLTVNGLGVSFLPAPGSGSAEQITKDAAYVFVLTDDAKTYYHTSGSTHIWTIPPNLFDVGAKITLINNTGGGAVTVARGAGVALIEAGTGTDQNATLAANAVAHIFKVGTDRWFYKE